MRHSELAHVVIRVTVGGRRYLLLRKNTKWNDWSLVGGHVEPGEEGDWARTAVRECEEELAPLKHTKDFVVVPLLRQPITWGPVASRSAAGAPTRYTAQFFALEFCRDAEECLARLPVQDFCLEPEASVFGAGKPAVQMLGVIRRSLPAGFKDVPLSWDGSIDESRVSIPKLASSRPRALKRRKVRSRTAASSHGRSRET
jgi:hypothetical protein